MDSPKRDVMKKHKGAAEEILKVERQLRVHVNNQSRLAIRRRQDYTKQGRQFTKVENRRGGKRARKHHIFDDEENGPEED